VDAAAVRRDGVGAKASSEPFGEDRDVGRPAAQRQAVLDVDVVRAIRPLDEIEQLAVEPEDRERAVRRRHLHRAEHQALARVGPVHPDRRVVWIERQGSGRPQRRDLRDGRLREEQHAAEQRGGHGGGARPHRQNPTLRPKSAHQ
jgi:hypothetical protein